MDISYTEAQAIALNALADAARRVRHEAGYAQSAAGNILFQLDQTYRPSEGFGKSKLAETVSRYNAVADVAGALCGDLSIDEVEASFAAANRAGTYAVQFRASR